MRLPRSLAALVLALPASLAAQDVRLLVRADDMGAAQSINAATIEAYRNGLVRSAEVIVPGPWFLDAVRLLRENPGLDVGVHLALTSEWERVKWGPLTPAPSLVDADGYFRPQVRQRPDFPAGTGMLEAGPKLDEVERELRAQIALAQRHLGPQLTHVSTHMFAARATPKMNALVGRLAREFGLRDGDEGVKFLWGAFGASTLPGEARAKALAAFVDTLSPGEYVLLEHPAYDTPEMRAIGHVGYENVAADRQGITVALTSAEAKAAVARRGIRLVSYRDLARAAQEPGTLQYTSPAGVAYRAARDTGEIARAEAALAAAPRDRQRYIALGTAQAGARQMREAVATFTRGLEALPDDPVLLRWRGHRYLSIREFAKARADLEKSARLDPSIYGAWYHLGVLRFMDGDFRGAADAFRRAQPIAPDAGELAGSTDWLWMSLMRAGRAKEAAAMLAARPDSLPVTNAYRQRLRLYRGEITPAQLFTPADTSDVNVATLSYGLGNWYLLKGDTAQARAAFERSVASGGWPAFGFMVSEAELARLRRR